MMRVAEAIYRVLLLLLPASFRRSLGAEMLYVFRAKLRDASGSLGKARVLSGSILDVISVAVAERRVFRPLSLRATVRDLPMEIRQAARALLRTPSYTVAAVATLAVAIGTVSAFFSVVNGVLLEPLPYRAADRLVIINSPFLTPGTQDGWLREQRTAEAMAAYTIGRGTALLPGGAVNVRTMPVSAGFFQLLGVTPTAGRVLLPSDHRPNAPPVAVLSERFWLEQIGGGNPAGRVLTIDDRSYEIVGLLPADFEYQYKNVDAWLPLEQADTRGVTLVARLPEGRTLVEARESFRQLAQRFATPELRKRAQDFRVADVNVHSVYEHVVGDARGTIWTLFGAALIVLLLGAANVATLSIGRALARRDELAVRSALGAGRFRILRQLVVEAVVLALWGAALGLVLTQFLPALLRLAPDFLPRREQIRLDLNVLLFALAATMTAVVIFGVLPGLAVARWNERTSLRAASARGQRASLVQSALVVFEVAAAVVLTIGALLLIQTYARLRPTRPGFQVENRMVASFALPTDPYADSARTRAFAVALVAGVNGLPGTPRAAIVTDLPLTGSSIMLPLKQPVIPGSSRTMMHFRAVSPNYLEVMEMPLLSGRPLLASDRAGAPNAAIVNETAARRLWPDQSPLGRTLQIELGKAPSDLVVVGVVRDAWIFQGPDTRPEIFASFEQFPFSRFSVVIAHTPGLPPGLQQLRQVVATIDPAAPVREVKPLRDVIAWTVIVPRFQATILSILTAIALILAATGCFAVLTQIIGRRAREFAVRMAVGAGVPSVVGLILRRATLLALTGAIIGIAIALAATRVLESYLHGVSRTDPATYAIAALGLTGIVIAAALYPARRLARLNPIDTLRQ
jgi:putative ABC transport system permease protein